MVQPNIESCSGEVCNDQLIHWLSCGKAVFNGLFRPFCMFHSEPQLPIDMELMPVQDNQSVEEKFDHHIQTMLYTNPRRNLPHAMRNIKKLKITKTIMTTNTYDKQHPKNIFDMALVIYNYFKE